MGGNEHGHTQLNCYAAVLIYVYLCSLRTVTLAVGILFRLGRVVGEWRVRWGGSGGGVGDTQPPSSGACLPLGQARPRWTTQVHVE